AEQLAILRARQLFGCDYANVQPHSGSQANQAVYMAALKPGDAILGMSLAHGGHLTHGAAVSASGKLYRALSYGLDAEEAIDYDGVERLAREHRPRMIVAGASAYSRVIDWRRRREIADAARAHLMADIAHYAGLVAAGLYPSPIGIADFVTSTTHKTLRGPRGGLILAGAEHEKILNAAVFPCLQGGPLMHVIAAKAVAFKEALAPEFRDYQKQVIANARVLAKALQTRGVRIVSGGTDCHMLLVDLRAKNVTGRDAEDALGRAHITVNKNAIPNDPQKPFVASGIRIGSPAMTTRGFREAEATAVIDSRESEDGDSVRRRRQCETCGKRFTTYERVELSMPMVVKSSGNRVPYDREKLRTGFMRALHKRPVPTEYVDQSINRIEQRVLALGEREVASRVIGEMVMRELKKMDDVA